MPASHRAKIRKQQQKLRLNPREPLRMAARKAVPARQAEARQRPTRRKPGKAAPLSPAPKKTKYLRASQIYERLNEIGRASCRERGGAVAEAVLSMTISTVLCRGRW